MIRICRLLTLLIILPPFLYFTFGLLFWLSAVRPDNFYLIEAIRSRALVSIWVNDEAKTREHHGLAVSFFAWLHPSKADLAFAHFDHWFREYLLLSNDTDEAADGVPYVLPPAIIPPPQTPRDVGPDHYDEATRQMIESFWNSGFLSFAGFIQPDVDFWLKSLLGWHAAGFSLEMLSKTFGVSPNFESSAPYLLNWLNRQPSAELEIESVQGLTVYESVLEVSAEQLHELHEKLCSVESIPELWCSGSSFEYNPIDPLLRISPEFKVQLKYFWTIRGGGMLWSNQKQCLISAFGQSATRFAHCAGKGHQSSKILFGREAVILLRSALALESRKLFGYFVNELELMFDYQRVLKRLKDVEKSQSQWMLDLLRQARFFDYLYEMSEALAKRAQSTPYWGASLVEQPPNSVELHTVTRWVGGDEQLDRILRPWAETQFEFLYGLMTAWSGLSRTPARLRRSEPWRSAAEFRQSSSVFEIGWSEKE